MNTVINLDFAPIRSTKTPLPDIGILDVEPMQGSGGTPSDGVKGHVLLLNDPSSLRHQMSMAPGPAIVTVRLPGGEILSQQVHVLQGSGAVTISFKVTGHKESRLRSPPGTSTIAKVVASQPKEVGTRGHWSPVLRADARVQTRTLSGFLNAFAHEVVNEKHDRLGLAKVQSEAKTFRFEDSLSSSGASNASMLGTIAAVQPAKLYGDVESLRASWQRPIRNRKVVETRDHEAKTKRYFAVGYQFENMAEPQQLACIPGNWRTVERDSLSKVRVRYVSERRAFGDDEHVLRVQIEDTKTQGLLEFMQTGDLYASSTLLSDAYIHLFEKTQNPYAAAAAGYVFLRTGMPNDEMGRWLYNLATLFPALPDGSILLATLLLQGSKGARQHVTGVTGQASERRIAYERVIASVRGGPPLFRMGLSHLHTNIQILKGMKDFTATETEALDEALAYVQDLTSRVDRTQPFSVFDVSADDL